MLEPNLTEAERFLNILDPKATKFTFQTIDESSTSLGNSKSSTLNSVFHGTFDEYKVKLGAANICGAGIFVMVNEGDGMCHIGFKTCRTIKSVIKVRALFVDLDGAPLQPALDYKLKPSMVIQTSADRYHAYWLVDGCPLDQFKIHQQALAKNLNGDPSVCDLPRVMRIPGFYHMKREPIIVKLIEPSGQV